MNGKQCRAARALLQLTQPALARLASVSPNLIPPFESGNAYPRPATLSKIRSALIFAGVEFIEDADGYGVKLRSFIPNGSEPRAIAKIPVETASRFDTKQPITPGQCRGARAMLRWLQSDAAEKLGVGVSLLKSFENGERVPQAGNLAKIEKGFVAAGIVFTTRPGFDGIEFIAST